MRFRGSVGVWIDVARSRTGRAGQARGPRRAGCRDRWSRLGRRCVREATSPPDTAVHRVRAV